MKNLFFTLLMVFFALISCRNDESNLQKIDQIIHLYIDSAGQDMLNSNIPGSYVSVQGNDMYGLLDNAPVNFSNRKDADTVNYLEYLAGARRIGIDAVGDVKNYESKIALILTKKVNNTTNAVTKDLLTIQYSSTPTSFQVSKVYYNNILKFTKVEGEPNIIKITK